LEKHHALANAGKIPDATEVHDELLRYMDPSL
jgi:hypothetical protein